MAEWVECPRCARADTIADWHLTCPMLCDAGQVSNEDAAAFLLVLETDGPAGVQFWMGQRAAMFGWKGGRKRG